MQSTVQFSFPQHMVTEAVRQLAPTLQADVKNEIREAAKELKGHVIKLPSGKEVHLEGNKHKHFQKATTLAKMHRQLFMAGPTGSGKTYLSEQVAEGLGLSFNHISCTVGMSEAHITGRMTATGEYVSTAFVEAYEKGGVFLFDEVDAADPNVLLIINSALSNGKISLPNRPEAPVAKRHKDCIIICAANTWGHGSADYTGREMLDRAFLDRFAMSRVHLDYDTELERDLTDKSSLTERLQSIRQKVDRPVSTRAILDAHRMSEAFSEQEIMEIFTLDWTSEEKAKAGI